MSSSQENTFLARNCAKCNEIMPLSERVCYCGGPVCIGEFPIDKQDYANCYYDRRMIFWLKNTKEE